uniref:two-component regulator propeller domain-containing protein n=1 Tax=Prevotella sp. TaxID=59823 RepID=UPI004027192A
MKPLRHLLLLLCLLLSDLAARSTPMPTPAYQVRHIGLTEGLDNMRVFSILQDRNDVIWIATKNGINRYNGSVVKVYRLSSDRVYSNAAGRIFSLRQDGDTLYAYDNKGNIYRYSSALDRFEHVVSLSKWFRGYLKLNDLYIDRRHRLWLAARNGLYCYDHGKMTLAGPTQEVNVITADNRGRLFIATATEVFAQHGKRWETLSGLEGLEAQSLYFDAPSQRLWVGSLVQGIRVYDLKDHRVGVVSTQPQIQHPVRAITPLGETTMLVGVDGEGVYAFDRRGQQGRLLFNVSDDTRNALSGNGIYTITVDRQHNIWMGSYTGGVDLAMLRWSGYQLFRHEYKDGNSLLDNGVNAACATADGTLWFGTNLGLSAYHPASGRWTHCLQGRVVLALCPSGNGGVWAGTYGNGVFAVSATGTATATYSRSLGTLLSECITSLACDHLGRLWVGAIDGPLSCIVNGKAHDLPIREAECLTAMGDKMAVGTTAGFCIVDVRTWHFKHYFNPGDFGDKDICCFINSIIADGSHDFWLGTDGGGIYHYDTLTKKYWQISTRQGLPSNTIAGICHGAQGLLMVSTDRGLCSFDGRTRRVRQLSIYEGLDQEYNRMACWQLPDGRLLFGGNDGGVLLAPAAVLPSHYTAQLRVTSILPLDTKQAEDSVVRRRIFDMLREGKVSLPYAQNSFTVDFECINYRFQHDIRYEYFLEGYDKQWISMQRLQSLRYTNVPSGSYTLHIRALSRTDGRVIDAKDIPLVIRRPWWNSFFAWTAYLLIVLSLVYLAWRWYRDRLESRYYNEKISFFVNTAHDIRTPLSLVLAPLDDMAKDSTLSEPSARYLSIARRNGAKLLKMITGLLDFQKIDQQSSEPSVQKIALKPLLEQQVARFALLAQEKKITLALDDCPGEALVWLDPMMAVKLFDNLISNAIKYTDEGGHIHLRAWQQRGETVISVADDGMGIPESDQRHIFRSFYRASNGINSKQMGSGLGLMLCRRLVELHHGKLTFISKEQVGTTFFVHLPADGSRYFPEATEQDEQQGREDAAVATSLSLKDSVIDARPDSANVNALKGDLTVDKPKMEAEVNLPQDEEDDENGKDTILFVDDNTELLRYLRMSFSGDYHIIMKESAEAALDYLREGTCDIVVSDVMMGGMDGNELCRRLKENADTAWLPVILLTAKVGKDFMIEGLDKGADDYIAKPFDTDILAKKIRNVIDNRRRLSKYYLRRALQLAHGGEEPVIPSPQEKTISTLSDDSPLAVQQDDSNEQQAEVKPEVLNADDQAFIDKATQTVLDHLSEENFDVNHLCREMAMSRTLFYGRLKTLTGKAPQEFMRLIRLEQAAALLRKGVPVLDVATRCGFPNSKYFSTVFKKHFGMPPSKYKKEE